ncbi:MAG: pH regulation protein F [Gammaproteobacteria bacterium]|nr:pH regulation protein F [Gammaproteobacteria bacterium]
MRDPYLVTALILLATVTAGLLRVFVGTARVERLLALQLLGTTTVAIVLLLTVGLQQPVLADVALVLGLLASIIAIAYVRYGTMRTDNDSPRPKQ